MTVRDRFRMLRARMSASHTDRPRRWSRWQWLGLGTLGALAFATILLDVWLVTCDFKGCPTRAELRAFRPGEGGQIMDREGRLLGRLSSVKRMNVPLSAVPLHVRQAFLAVEDRRFLSHNGIDWRGLARAAVRNTAAFGVREGFSTITMQVARNTFVSRLFSQRTLRRKLLELRLTRLMERDLGKAQILELYLNVIYLGNGVYGVEAASRDLFGKSVSQLTVSEGAMLAALPKGPSVYTPRKSVERATKRRDLVLGLMERERFLTADQLKRARAVRVRVAPKQWTPSRAGDSYALDLVRSAVDSLLDERQLESGDVTVYTTIDGPAQRAADAAVRKRADLVTRETREWYGRSAGNGAEGAMVALDPRTGEIRALTGGRVFVRGAFNRATEAHRQPGSAFKPFVYAAALTRGFSPATMVDDSPIDVQIGRQVWSPENFDGEYLGRVTLRRALMKSANAATVRLSHDNVGERRVVELARRSGIRSPLEAIPSIALGAIEVTPLELVTAYAPFANGGYRVVPRLIRRIDGADGIPLWSASPPARVRVLSAEDSYQITSMLRAAVDRGTGRAVRDLGVTGPVAGKTGTTNNGTDVWFVGYTPTLVAGFWFGYDTPRPLSGNAAGGRLAAPAWADFYLTGWRERSAPNAWAAPAGMVGRDIDPSTGELAAGYCPSRVREWFKPGTEPSEPCRIHRDAPEPEPMDSVWTDSTNSGFGNVLRRVFKF